MGEGRALSVPLLRAMVPHSLEEKKLALNVSDGRTMAQERERNEPAKNNGRFFLFLLPLRLLCVNLGLRGKR